METSDDPLTIAAVGGGLFLGKALSKGGEVDMPAVQAENVKRTARPVEQISDKKSKRRAASVFFKDEPPQLSQAGLLGL